MAKVRKAKYIYKDGVYYEVGGGSSDSPADLSDLILVQDTQPTTPDNKIWIKETATPVVIPDMDDIADFVSFSEDQTSRTDAEKAQARANIGASPEYVVEPHFISGQTMTANEAKVFEIGIDKSGYTPVCVVGVRPEYPMTIAVYFWGIVGDKGMVKIRNVANSAVGSFTLTIDVLYRKNDPS